VFLSAVSSEFETARNEIANDLDSRNIRVRVQRSFRQEVGADTVLRLLHDYIASCTAVVCVMGKRSGAFPTPAEAAPFAHMLPPGLTQASYTQWEFIFARHHQRRLSVYLARDDYNPDRAAASYDRPDVQKAFLAYVHGFGRLYSEFPDTNGLCRQVLKEDWPPKTGRKPKNLPFASLGPLFKGREQFLNDLHTALAGAADGKAAAVTGKAVHGLGGVGKTRVAIEYAWRHAWEYTALLFVPAETRERLDAGLAGLVGTDMLDLPEKDEREDAVKLSAALRWLEQHPTWLMILDNVDDRKAAEAVEQLLPKLSGGRVLITARNTNFAASIETLELDVLSADDATEFLLERTWGKRRETPDDGALARELATELDGLALGLEQAGAYIATQRITFERYLKLWKESRAKVLGWFDRSLMSYNHDVGLAATWVTSVEKLTPAGRRLLERLAFFAPDPIPESLLDVVILPPPGEGGREAAGWGNSDAPRASRRSLRDLLSTRVVGFVQPLFSLVLRRPAGPSRSTRDASASFDAYEALADLDAYSLVTRSKAEDSAKEPAFAVHRLVQDFTRRGLEELKRRQILKEALRWLNAGFAGDSQDVRTWPKLDPLAPHALALADRGYAAGIAEPTARLYNELGRLYHGKERHAEAEPLMRCALAIDKASYGPDYPFVAADLNNLASLLQDTNRPAEAEPLYRRALAIFEASFGPDYPFVATVLDNLAQLHRETSRLAEAEPLMRRALAIDEASYGPDHPSVAIRLNNFAQLLSATNRLMEAEPLMRRALAIDEASYGPDHPRVATDLNNLAGLLRDTNRLMEAEPLSRRALAIYEASYGPDHPDVSIGLNNLAQLLQDTNRPTEAERLMRRHVEILLSSMARTDHPHPHLFDSFNNYGNLLIEMGLSEAEALATLEAIADKHGLALNELAAQIDRVDDDGY
jgi:tetratricopeptide (TPR) repeat protein